MITKKAYPQAKWKLWWPEEDIISKTFYVLMLVCNGPLVTSSSQLVVIEGLSLIWPDSSYRSMEILTMFVNRIRQMVSFELGRGIEKDVFHLVLSRAWDKENKRVPMRNRTWSYRNCSMQDACQMKFEIDLAHRGVSSTPFSSRSIYFTTLTC